VVEEEEKSGAPRWCAPFIAAGGSGRWRRKLQERWAGTAAAKLWVRARQWPPLSEGTQRGLVASVRTGSPTGGSRAVFDFSNLSKTGSTLKIQNGCLILL
jgi:hypothetical protein